ncbi:MAG: hypothetical protein LBC73_08165 [Oscillospiraceae bacterium]|jgi:hypothetical protein|nr:hypothetical protein [Oscillospiraceae bacterium]
MLGKLMNYEILAMGRVFLPLYGALIIVSIVSRVLQTLPTNTPAIISIIVAVILIASISILTLILILERFRKNLLSNEGYLMMTLPVSVDKLILSKMLVSSICSVASTIVVTISIIILSAPWSAIVRFFHSLAEDISAMLNNEPIFATILTIEILFLQLLILFSSILLLYTCLSLGMLTNKYRRLVAFGFFIAITTLLQILVAVITTIMVLASISERVSSFINSLSDFGQSQAMLLPIIILVAGIGLAFYLITRYMLKNKLNLHDVF